MLNHIFEYLPLTLTNIGDLDFYLSGLTMWDKRTLDAIYVGLGAQQGQPRATSSSQSSQVSGYSMSCSSRHHHCFSLHCILLWFIASITLYSTLIKQSVMDMYLKTQQKIVLNKLHVYTAQFEWWRSIIFVYYIKYDFDWVWL